MGFTKGNQAAKKNKGVPKKNTIKRMLAWEELGDFITTAGAEKAVEIMRNSDNDKFLNYYTTLLEYFRPKLARQELTGKDGSEIKFSLTQILTEIDGKTKNVGAERLTYDSE